MTKVSLSFIPYQAPFLHNKTRSGTLIKASSAEGLFGLGEVAPLPGWSQETLEEALNSLQQQQQAIEDTSWSFPSLFSELATLSLTPSALFGLETALLNLLDPLSEDEVEESALFMGTYDDILKQAKTSTCKSAKVKISSFSPIEIRSLVQELSSRFYLRLDANRAFTEKEALEIFSDMEGIDYIEEPLIKGKGLEKLPFPIAIDESYPSNISLQELFHLPSLKAVVYKPTIQGGMTNCLPLLPLAKEKKIEIVLSSCFETSIGQKGLKKIAKRLSLNSPIGTGTKSFFPCPFVDK